MHPTPAPQDCLLPGPCVDSDHPAIAELAASLTQAGASDIENAVSMYYWTRDSIRYNPYALDVSAKGLSASRTLQQGEGWCVPKAILLAALCRASGIPACLGYADVRNHLSTERLRQSMGTDLFYYHGYTAIWLEGRWVKATPAFNIELCEKFGLRPLKFNGREDSLYHEFDVAGNRHMEYVAERGEFVEPPIDDMIACFQEHYPNMALSTGGALAADNLQGANWDQDVAHEVGSS